MWVQLFFSGGFREASLRFTSLFSAPTSKCVGRTHLLFPGDLSAYAYTPVLTSNSSLPFRAFLGLFSHTHANPLLPGSRRLVHNALAYGGPLARKRPSARRKRGWYTLGAFLFSFSLSFFLLFLPSTFFSRVPSFEIRLSGLERDVSGTGRVLTAALCCCRERAFATGRRLCCVGGGGRGCSARLSAACLRRPEAGGALNAQVSGVQGAVDR
ncbi:hypothetical protein B0H17DRAFT_1069473 [Mycena rosella]|uniref:Transmembrane protein n=1 Tax=Mycena rosella TaxID=1033263 RepID=A0AAD7DBN7_MYCRO|nr:hypothetical protein B0H17DRAFT_1069473 [Mycena rosella]